ncbi:hypothetical protein Q5752_001351 [Cryptotrichosporon argae]
MSKSSMAGPPAPRAPSRSSRRGAPRPAVQLGSVVGRGAVLSSTIDQPRLAPQPYALQPLQPIQRAPSPVFPSILKVAGHAHAGGPSAPPVHAPPPMGDRAHSAPIVPTLARHAHAHARAAESTECPGSSQSISTAASSSSHTLKLQTPQSKSHGPDPASSGSLDAMAASPPARLARPDAGAHDEWAVPVQHRRKGSGDRLKGGVAFAQAPLTKPGKTSTGLLGGRKGGKAETMPAGRDDHRLSQGWMQVDEFGEIHQSTPPRQLQHFTFPQQQQQHRQPAPAGTGYDKRVPPPIMVPLKQASPPRPRFERAATAPPASPTEDRRPSASRSRSSLDQLRSTSPSPAPRAPRKSSLSTPPAVVVEDARRRGLPVSHKAPPPPLATRRSDDVVRNAPGPQAIEAPQDKDKGLSFKKSSGALKALFRGGKAKDKDVAPPMPAMPSAAGPSRVRPSDDRLRPTMDTSRSSVDELRPRPSMSRSNTPGGSPAPSAASYGRRTPDFSRTPEFQRTPDFTRTPDSRTPDSTGRSSFAADRSLYPAPPQLQRASSTGAQAALSVDTRRSPPQRQLPPLPPLSPVPGSQSAAFAPVQTKPYLPDIVSLGPSSAPSRAQLASPALLVQAPYASAIASPARSDSTADSSDTAGPRGQWSPVKPSKSLHLLSLPDLDLSFDFNLDAIGGSPGTSRRSPKGSPKSRASPRSPRSTRTSPSNPGSPQRSASVSASSSFARAYDRPRSKSFDAFADNWAPLHVDAVGAGLMSPTIRQLFDAESSMFTPTEPVPMRVPVPVDFAASHPATSDGGHSQSHSLSSQPSVASDQSPSDAASSATRPRTPEERSPPLPDHAVVVDDKAQTIPTQGLALAVPAEIAITVTMSNSNGSLVDMGPVEAVEIVHKTGTATVREPRTRRRALQTRSKVVTPTAGVSVRSLTLEMERLLNSYRYPTMATMSAERSALIRAELVPCLYEVEKQFECEAHLAAAQMGAHALRHAAFEWADLLLHELQVEQAANERGACLEGLGAVLESACLGAPSLAKDTEDEARFRRLMVRVMGFVMDKLGAKGVFHNTLLFSGRFLAFAFFRIPHIGDQLVTVLQPPRGALMRFTRAALLGAPVPAEAQPKYPAHLQALCFDNARAYTARLNALSPEFTSEDERDAFLFTPGNWLRRWQSDDSELFPAFYRAYHRQLALYLAPAIEYYEARDEAVPTAVLLRAPGYAHLATMFAKKCHSYILGSVNAVTTSSAAQAFEATETAGFRGSQKPAVLETANRRLVETLATFANTRVLVPAPAAAGGRMLEVDGTQLWSEMMDYWAKSLIGKTSLYAPKGVFCLFDLLDGIVDPPAEVVTELSTTAPAESLLDVAYVIHTVRVVLTQGEHALTLVKVIAFVFTHWEVLTAHADDRRELCLELLLEKQLFERLLLFWSQSVRSYILRLVVFRLGHLHTTSADPASHAVEIESVRLLQTRLEAIKRRHDELEPSPGSDASSPSSPLPPSDAPPLTPTDGSGTGGAGMTRSRSTITMIADSPRTGNVNKAEKLLGLGLGIQDGPRDREREVGPEPKKGSWWKRSFGANKRKKSAGDAAGHVGASPTPPPAPQVPSGDSPKLDRKRTPKLDRGASPAPLGAAALAPAPVLVPSPALSSPSTNASTSPTDAKGARETMRKPRPPQIYTGTGPAPVDTDADADVDAAAAGVPRAHSPSGHSFEFELPTASPRSDTFDPSPSPRPGTPGSPARHAGPSQPPSPRGPASPHMSRSFSKRGSLLPPATARQLALEAEADAGRETPHAGDSTSTHTPPADKGYDKRLHPYAVRMLAELEDAQKEYNEWWSDGGVGKVDGAPPRLAVAWPFHEGDE